MPLQVHWRSLEVAGGRWRSLEDITLRLRTRDGMLRCALAPSASVSELWSKATELTKRDRSAISLTTSSKARIPASGPTVRSLGLQHGDIITVDYEGSSAEPATTAAAAAAAGSSASSAEPTASVPAAHPHATNVLMPVGAVREDKVDTYMESQDGLIHRKRDPHLCRHGDKGMCEYCSPLEPFDPKYMEENKIKHLSFHAHLRKLQGKRVAPNHPNFIPPLTPFSLKVQENCTSGHAPWPQGICSKCQPSAVSLQRQTFRMVDHVEFASPDLVDTLLGAWRATGTQRFAYMYGKYLAYDKVPLGIKAVVTAMYEPQQENAADGLRLAYVDGAAADGAQAKEARAELEVADKVARACGLVRVGMIFTDLQDDGSGKGAVRCKRHEKSFFLSSLEAILAAHMQSAHPTSTKYSTTGQFGSRFVTCIVSGNSEGGIEVEAYQVSEQAVALVDADLVEPSIQPMSVLVKPRAPTRYVPDVIYQARNEYGTLAQHTADPAFPVDYLLVNVTHGFPSAPGAGTTADAAPQFARRTYPAAHRVLQPQDAGSLARALHAADGVGLADFNALVHVASLGLLTDAELADLGAAAVNIAAPGSTTENLKGHPVLDKLRDLIPPPDTNPAPAASARSGPGASSSGGFPADVATPAPPPASRPWACRHCTFQNEAGTVDCEMCGLPQ